MKKCFLIVKSNFRKTKGQNIAIFSLLLLASIMLNLWLMLAFDYKANFNRQHELLNAEDVTFVVSEKRSEVEKTIKNTLDNDKRTKEYSLNDSLLVVGMLPYNDGEVNSKLIFLDKETALSKEVGKIEMIEDSSYTSGIYLPMIYKTGSVKIGETITISLFGKEFKYTVCGFFNSIMAGSHNCGLIELVLSQDAYLELQESSYVMPSTICSIRINDKKDCENYEAMLNSHINAKFPSAIIASNSYNLVVSSRYISQMICASIISAMVFLVLIIVLVVISSNIVNYIKENMKKIGILKAIGYTSNNLRLSLIIQFLSISVLVTIIGIIGSYVIFPFVNQMMIEQTGIPYHMHFLFLPTILTILLINGIIILTVFASTSRIKTIEPIIALREGLKTHNFKKNYIPLEKAKTPLNLSLALKTTITNVKQNITICITMLVLSLIVVFTGMMYKNMIEDYTPFINLIAGEMADSCISIKQEEETKFIEEMNKDDRVDKIYLYHSEYIHHEEKTELMANICDDFSKVNNKDVCYEGRFPKYDNEIAIAKKYAKIQNLKIGDEITINAKGKNAKYIITGYTQITNNLGKDCLLTKKGFEKLGEIENPSYYINLKDGVNIKNFNDEIEKKYAVNLCIDIDEVITGSIKVYISLMKVIVCAIIIISLAIITFVTYLLVRTLISNKKKEYGILKSLGFTTKQLIVQTALSFMPVVIISTIIGTILGCIIMNPFVSLFMSNIGIVKCTFQVPLVMISFASIILIIITFGITCLLSIRIRKISCKELLVGE